MEVRFGPEAKTNARDERATRMPRLRDFDIESLSLAHKGLQ
jgi:hypothetical protein